MNGRVYDPFLGRMISADPTVPGGFDGQALNRYSYVLNNPMIFVDPSGFGPQIGAQGTTYQDGSGGNNFGMQAPNIWRQCEGVTGNVNCTVTSIRPEIIDTMPTAFGDDSAVAMGVLVDADPTALDPMTITGNRVNVDLAAYLADLNTLVSFARIPDFSVTYGLSMQVSLKIPFTSRDIEFTWMSGISVSDDGLDFGGFLVTEQEGTDHGFAFPAKLTGGVWGTSSEFIDWYQSGFFDSAPKSAEAVGLGGPLWVYPGGVGAHSITGAQGTITGINFGPQLVFRGSSVNVTTYSFRGFITNSLCLGLRRC